MKPEASSGGGGGDRPRYSSHHNNSNSSHIKDKVRCSSSASSSVATSVHRSMSEPGFHMLEAERHREERVVVKAYGNAAPPSPQNLGLLPAHSTSPVMPIAGVLEPGRDVTGSGRKRPGRKTRRPDGYGGLSPENGFSSSFQIGDLKEGGCKIQAEQICKEAPLRGTNNYASLLSSPSPSSIPNPSFKTKLSFFSAKPATSSGDPCTRPEENIVQHISSSPSGRSEFPHNSDVRYVENFSPLLASPTSASSPALDVVSIESSSASEANPKGDCTGNDSSEGEVSTPPATSSSDLMTRFEATYAGNFNFHTAKRQEEKSDASSTTTWQDGSRFANPKSVILSGSPETGSRYSNGIVQEVLVSSAESRSRTGSPSAIQKTKVSLPKSSRVQNDFSESKKGGVHGMGTKQSTIEKRIGRSSPVSSSRSPTLKTQFQDSQSQWKAVSSGVNEEAVCNLPSIGSTGEGLSESSHSWLGPGSSLLGSQYGSSGGPVMERSQAVGAAQPVVGAGRNSVQSKMFSDHWSSEAVDQAIEEGQIFKATFRVNSHNRHEAYVTVDGLPLDLLIDGLPAQNRAMEGDIVAVMIEPTSAWSRLKGSFVRQASPEPATVCDGVFSATERDKNILEASVSRVETEHPENLAEDVKDLLRLDDRSSETRHRNFISKDCNRKVSSIQEDTRKSKSGLCNNGRLVDQKTTVSGNTVYQILKRPTADDATGSVALLSSMERRLSVTSKVPTVTVRDTVVERVESVCSKPTSGVYSGKIAAAVASLISRISSCPGKRPTAKVVAIVQNSTRRESVVGFLEVPQNQRGGSRSAGRGFRDDSPQKRKNVVTMLLVPTDSRCPKMLVPPNCLPADLYQRLKEGDSTVSTELVAARVDTWRVDSYLPSATVIKSLGQGGEIEPQLKAILFENNAHPPDFPQASLDCLPRTPWKIPVSEMKKRVDLRRCRVFSIDPPTARDLDDALSVEKLGNGIVRVGVHIADVTYFISPGSELDKEAAHRSTSIYLEQRVLPMLPRLLCEELCSLNPGVDRLAFSVVWDISASGDILDQWIGRTVINSCAKLTYEHAQDMIEGVFMDMEGAEAREGLSKSDKPLPQIYGHHSWPEVMADVLGLYEIAKKRRDSRVEGGALKLNNSKIMFSLDEDGTPYESSMYKTKDSNFVVEEFMLLANMTVAKVISNAFPDSALLRRHPEPNMRKLKEFEEFCEKNQFDLDTSSSGALRLSLEKMQDRVSYDPVLYNILMVFATKPMQLAKYFCTGELKDKEEDWGHYALACPLYTHFTSPIRRYPDVLVHRMLAAALEAEEILIASDSSLSRKGNKNSVAIGKNLRLKQCFSSAKSQRGASDYPIAQNALAIAAENHKLPASSDLMGIAAHCNERKMASRNVKEASDKLYLWAMLKKKGGLLSDSRVLALGPKFMTLYICKIAMERRIYYDEIEGVNAEWFEATGTLVLDISTTKKSTPQKRSQGRSGRQRTVADIAMVVNPADGLGNSPEKESYEDIIREVEQRLAGKDFPFESPPAFDVEGLASDAEVEPTVLPLTLRLFSAVPVSLHSVGGGADHRPLDVAVKLYVSSYAT